MSNGNSFAIIQSFFLHAEMNLRRILLVDLIQKPRAAGKVAHRVADNLFLEFVVRQVGTALALLVKFDTFG